MKLLLYQIDAFSSSVFSGNPAAVVPLEAWLPDATLQAIALENNLSETAFFVPAGSDSEADFDLRWFTPALEVDLCGHATLASAHVLVEHLGFDRSTIVFSTQSGLLTASRRDGLLVLDFPAWPGEPVPVTDEIAEALGSRPVEAHRARDLMTVYTSEADVRGLSPDFPRVRELDALGVMATAPGQSDDADFVCRFFAPRAGIDEDPVTGSAYCTLIPYWVERLGKSDLHARQISARGGELFCRHEPGTDRVEIAGAAVTYLEGTIDI